MIKSILKDKIPDPSNKKDYELYKLNEKAMYAHLINFVTQVMLYYYQDSNGDPYNIRITEKVINIHNPDQADLNNEFNRKNFSRLTNGEKTLYTMPLALIVSAFSYMSFLAHFAILILGGRYYSWIEYYKINFARWIEYSISSPTMMLIIAGLTRSNEISTMNSILISTLITNVFGLMSEVLKGNQDYGYLSKIIFSLGFLPFRSSWKPILSNFKRAMDYVTKKDGSTSQFIQDYEDIHGQQSSNFYKDFEIPEFVKYTVYILYGLYYLFPVNMWLQRFYLPKKNKNKFLGIKYDNDPYFFGEKGFIYLSFISKATLSWILFSGTRRTNENKWLKGDSYYENSSITNIDSKWIYGGLGVLTGGVLYFANKYALEPNTKVIPNRMAEEKYFMQYLKNKNIEELSDIEVKELDKLLKIIDIKREKKLASSSINSYSSSYR
ncbi:hypothetical protein CPAV1605_533 [seawater metagenome]|uniref:Uncharacterized protein n=1 Tax=seawater metagenome TaxID=1561972 RepID=A0A5E8CHD7_9ZZZZ